MPCPPPCCKPTKLHSSPEVPHASQARGQRGSQLCLIVLIDLAILARPPQAHTQGMGRSQPLGWPQWCSSPQCPPNRFGSEEVLIITLAPDLVIEQNASRNAHTCHFQTNSLIELLKNRLINRIAHHASRTTHGPNHPHNCSPC